MENYHVFLVNIIYIVIMMMNQWIWGYFVFRQSQWHTVVRGMIPSDADEDLGKA